MYFDFQSTTPLVPEVREVMDRAREAAWANPHSLEHSYGWAARDAVSLARARVAGAVSCLPDCVVFTSGATEANSMVLLGLERHLREAGRLHVLVSAVEHASVLACADELAARGFSVERVPVSASGVVSCGDVMARLRPDTGLVSVMAVNNEIGTVQPVKELAAALRERGILFHTDASQALGRVPLRAEDADFFTLSSHKAYGPKGIGALVAARPMQKLLRPLVFGGGQQEGLRPGTLCPVLCSGFGMAAEMAEACREADAAHAALLMERFRMLLDAGGVAYEVQGCLERRVPHNLNLRFKGVDVEVLQAALPEIAFSSGSACSSDGAKTSHVLRAIGVDHRGIHECFRFSVGRPTRMEEVESFALQLIDVVKSARR